MCASGVLPSLRTVSSARTAICCSALRSRTSKSKSVKVTACRSASSAVGALAIWTAGGAAAGPACGEVWVVVWPFSSVEREKITLPPGGFCWAAGATGSGVDGV